MKLLKKVFIILLLSSFSIGFAKAQTEGPYDPSLDAHMQLSKAIKQAKSEHKHVFLMIGGNW